MSKYLFERFDLLLRGIDEGLTDFILEQKKGGLLVGAALSIEEHHI